MFVYFVGNTTKSVFQLGIASDPFRQLSLLQVGNPYKLSLLSKISVRNKNEAQLVERMGRMELEKYEGEGGWYADVPELLAVQFVSEHYLRRLAGQIGVEVCDRTTQATGRRRLTDLQRLIPAAKRNELTFEVVLGRVERAYEEGIDIDELMEI